jgi:PEP-CTERM motif-containing protein
MKTMILLLMMAVFQIVATLSYAQVSFQNLNFESANLTGYQPGSLVPISDAMPGWTAYYAGTQQTMQVWYDSTSLGSAFIAVNDINNSFGFAPIEGTYTVLLQGQFSSTFPSPVSAAIAQTGQIPMTAHSLFFWGNNNSLQVTFNGQVIPYTAFGNGPNYTIYGGDISGFAGQTGELRFTSFNFGGDSLDNIQFSPKSVPEPSVLGLFALGSLLLGWRLFSKQR